MQVVIQTFRVLNSISFHSVFSVLPMVYLLLLVAGCGADRPVETGGPAQVTGGLDGKALFDLYCIACHGAGPEHPGTMRLQERFSEAQAPLLNRDNLPPEYVKLVVREGFKLMPPFRPSEISDAQLDLLTGFITGEDN